MSTVFRTCVFIYVALESLIITAAHYENKKCIICFEEFLKNSFERRRLLNCGHDICQNCLAALLSLSKEHECPACRSTITHIDSVEINNSGSWPVIPVVMSQALLFLVQESQFSGWSLWGI